MNIFASSGCRFRLVCAFLITNQELYNIIKCKLVNTFDKVCIVGDFNFPIVEWDREWPGIKDKCLWNALEMLFSPKWFQNPLEEERDKPQIC